MRKTEFLVWEILQFVFAMKQVMNFTIFVWEGRVGKSQFVAQTASWLQSQAANETIVKNARNTTPSLNLHSPDVGLLQYSIIHGCRPQLPYQIYYLCTVDYRKSQDHIEKVYVFEIKIYHFLQNVCKCRM